ncbi:MAG: hypothetical protein JWO57_2730 [Pseudonocardiales bacterium]|nr:hypothetical protein [Pseudonocardiales bacterium]
MTAVGEAVEDYGHVGLTLLSHPVSGVDNLTATVRLGQQRVSSIKPPRSLLPTRHGRRLAGSSAQIGRSNGAGG